MKYQCKNCGSVSYPGLKAEYQSISVRCSFCHYESPLAPISDFETPEQREQRTGEPWPENGAVYGKYHFDDQEFGEFELMEHNAAKRDGYDVIVCATEAGRPPDSWEPDGWEPDDWEPEEERTRKGML
jgi:hypothetical protein